VQFWFEPLDTETLAPERFPVNLWEHAPGRFFYTFPADPGGFKVALHHEGTAADPERLQRGVGAGEAALLKELLARHLPGLAGSLRTGVACMYTNTPDGDFVIDRHPAHPGAIVVSACSGHGFKFAPTIGEIVSDLLVEGGTRWDIGRFALGRWK
jgi:sarcosine oxidase